MRNTFTLAAKEIKSYFTSPMGYIVAAAFLFLTSFFFVNSISTPFPEASIRGYLYSTTFILVLFAPAITMRLLAEEQKLGTIELLLTSPVRDIEVVLGKFLASLAFFVIALAFTLYYVILLIWFGKPDMGPVMSGYLGLLLFGAVCLSIGLLTSSFTSNQIVAFVLSAAILLLLTLVDRAASLTGGIGATILNQLSISQHFDDFGRGVVDTSNVIYYLSVTAVFLFFTVLSLETRRWR